MKAVNEITVDFGDGFDGAGRIGRTVNLIAIGADAEASAKGRFRIAAAPPSCFNGQSARLRTGGPGGPVGPLTVPGAVGHFMAVTRTAGAVVARCRRVAAALAALAPVALGAVAFMGAVVPVAPVAPASINCWSN